ncbi:WD40 repeat domain-containing protein [Paludifilum halophilum]|uniref:Uncharacterized protein n=1 Tax=Paludifilum halophilum TaxID=1642702 RepID=A0A235B3W8_9BACL|nr:hypothetical protein [Paludifilum halophilum]OYD06998.1 hypothetical protein CHM34_13780 [Paludifilum halophilum]
MRQNHGIGEKISEKWRIFTDLPAGRNRWLLFMGLALVLVGFFWTVWYLGQDDSSPEVLKEAVFSKIVPYLFRNERFYFWGEVNGQGDYYVFDLKKARLRKEDWIREYGDNEKVYRLNDRYTLDIQTRNGSRSLLLEDSSGNRKRVTDHLPQGKQPLSIAESGEAFVYAEEAGGKVDLYLYRIGTKDPVALSQSVSPDQLERPRWVQWSGDGKYVLVSGRWVYRVKDGGLERTLPGTGGTWSPQGDRLAYIGSEGKDKPSEEDFPTERTSPRGKKVVLWNAGTGDERVIFRAESEQWVVREVAWDPEGRYLAFPTGKQEKDETTFEEIHVMDGKAFHYVESEQNLMPTRLENMLLSKGGNYLSYSVNGILKLINLNTQESRVYDVYTQEEQDQTEYIRYDPGGVWLGQTHAILYVADNMEEKQVYRTPLQITGFYLSSRRDKLLVIEELTEGQKLRLIRLQSEKTSPSTKDTRDGSREEAAE